MSKKPLEEMKLMGALNESIKNIGSRVGLLSEHKHDLDKIMNELVQLYGKIVAFCQRNVDTSSEPQLWSNKITLLENFQRVQKSFDIYCRTLGALYYDAVKEKALLERLPAFLNSVQYDIQNANKEYYVLVYRSVGEGESFDKEGIEEIWQPDSTGILKTIAVDLNEDCAIAFRQLFDFSPPPVSREEGFRIQAAMDSLAANETVQHWITSSRLQGSQPISGESPEATARRILEQRCKVLKVSKLLFPFLTYELPPRASRVSRSESIPEFLDSKISDQSASLLGIHYYTPNSQFGSIAQHLFYADATYRQLLMMTGVLFHFSKSIDRRANFLYKTMLDNILSYLDIVVQRECKGEITEFYVEAKKVINHSNKAHQEWAEGLIKEAKDNIQSKYPEILAKMSLIAKPRPAVAEVSRAAAAGSQPIYRAEFK